MRTYHLIDIENQLGGTTWDAAAVQWAADAYRRLVPIAAEDLVTVVAGRRLLFAAHAAFPGADIRVADGQDAADLKLIFHAEVAWLAERFDRVVVASGDHIFSGLLASLRLAGVATVAVGRMHSVSKHIRAEADAVVWLPEPTAAVAAVVEQPQLVLTLDADCAETPTDADRRNDVERWILDLRHGPGASVRRRSARRHGSARSPRRHAVG